LRPARGLLARNRMGRPPRFIPAGSIVEFTGRTNNAMHLLRPSPELNDRILMVLGRALLRYPILLHAFVFLSNHWHALASVADAAQASGFLQYVHANVAKAAQQVHGWGGTVWGRRGQIIPVLDDAAADDRLRYILAHGAKEGLVASPLDWPGVSSAGALVRGDTLVGFHRRSRRGPAAEVVTVIDEYPITIAPLPSWAPLSTAERQARARALLDDIERQARIDHPRAFGADAVQRKDPFSSPAEPKMGRAPLAHVTSPAVRESFRHARACFIAAYRSAGCRVGDVATPAARLFPAGALLPRIPAPALLACPDAPPPEPARAGATPSGSSGHRVRPARSAAALGAANAGRSREGPSVALRRGKGRQPPRREEQRAQARGS